MAISGRVTEGSIHTRVLANLQRNLARGDKVLEQLASGKLINRPSDSPTGTVSSMQLRAEARSSDRYARNADDGLSWLSTVETALSGTSDLINLTRDRTLQGLNGANGPAAREALAVEIDQIRESMIAHANTNYLGRPVFGGTTAGAVAYEDPIADPAVNQVYVGNTGQTTRTVGAGVEVRVDTSGPQAFGADGSPTQLFAVLQSISQNLRAGDQANLSNDLKNLDIAAVSVRTATSDVGSRYNRLTQMKDMAEDRKLAVTSQLSDIEDIDLPKTIMEMKLHETSYQAALAASAKVIQPSLIDYLR